MNLKGKNVLVVGLGISGISAARFLHKKGAVVTVNDLKNEEQLSDVLESLKGVYNKAILGVSPEKCFKGIED